MSTQETDTEQLILKAAKNVFFKKGYDGARMQEIADEAGMNKALLHYYFRSKDKLFEAIFKNAFQQFIPVMVENILSGISLEKKIEIFVDNYLKVLIENPQLPNFVLTEINRDPDRIFEMFGKMGFKPEIVLQSIQKDMDEGKVKSMDPRHLLINIISLCAFPFAAKPLMQIMLFNNDAQKYNDFLEERKKEVSQFIIHSIKIN
ncbi:MAG: helix-turn-helix domain-containing protein [Bacteroidota bacterium]